MVPSLQLVALPQPQAVCMPMYQSPQSNEDSQEEDAVAGGEDPWRGYAASRRCSGQGGTRVSAATIRAPKREARGPSRVSVRNATMNKMIVARIPRD
ncbi:hypothetical protein V3C99_009148 [Haemonchus contortus]|uniref:Uncharacterized protein n=1 Tax=Haemonchus contortus TaxID=6289 RepID=A0A7I4YM17_HAECO